MKNRAILFSIFLAIFFVVPLISQAEEAIGEDNPLCWDEKVCIADYTGPDGRKDGIPDGIFDNQSSRAKETCPGSGFCYTQPEGYKLNVSLPLGATPTTVVFGLGDYIDKMYKFLLAISMIFAVVMIMVGGIQYIFSPGGDGKKRITNAVTGLILLFCATLILFTVNPQLIMLNFTSIPKIRTNFYFGGKIRCEQLKEQDYRFDNDLSDYDGNSCGTNAKAVDKGIDHPINPIECVWTGCVGELDYSYEGGNTPLRVVKSCYWDVGGNPGCVSCEEVTTGPEFESKVVPSASTCAALQPIFYNEIPNPKWHATCEFSHDLGFEPSEPLNILTNGQCAVVAYNCENINDCNDYDLIIAFNNDGQQNLQNFDPSTRKEICESNPCGFGGGCKQSSSDLSCEPVAEAPAPAPDWTSHQDTGR